jgi:hypothetical protein
MPVDASLESPADRIVIRPDGTVVHIQADSITRITMGLGKVQITRASSVEPDEHGNWFADCAPIGGPRLGPFPPDARDVCLAAEATWIRNNYLRRPSDGSSQGT